MPLPTAPGRRAHGEGEGGEPPADLTLVVEALTASAEAVAAGELPPRLGVPDGAGPATEALVDALNLLLEAVEARVGALERRRDELDRALEHAARLSVTDGLTGLSNRRHFERTAATELQRARRFGEPFGVVLVDVDELKAVNDSHGHQAGDAVLMELARRLTAATRDVDLVARIGGDEFVLLLPNTDAAGTRTLGGKLIERVNAAPFVVGGTEYSVTVSIGLASYPDGGDTVKELLANADAALYRAKAAGRNQVEGAG